MGIFNISVNDVFEYRQCPRKLAVSARRALKTGPYLPSRPPYQIEDVNVVEMREPTNSPVMPKDTMSPRAPLEGYANYVVNRTLGEVEHLSEILRDAGYDIIAIGRGEARHPGMICFARLDLVAITSTGKPIVVGLQQSPFISAKDEFKAKFFNGLADSHGVFLIKERIEQGRPILTPRVLTEQAGTVIICPGLEPEIIREKLVVDAELLRNVALATQIGFREMVPQESCGPDCRHNSRNLRIAKSKLNALRPLPLAFCNTLLEERYDFDTYWQATYSWELKSHAQGFFEAEQPTPTDWKEWLVDVAGLDKLMIDEDSWPNFWKTSSATLLKNLDGDDRGWVRIFGSRLDEKAASTALGLGKSVCGLSSGSEQFLMGALNRWRNCFHVLS